MHVAIANVLPWNNGHPARDPAILELNAGVAALAASEHIELLEFHATLEGPSRPGTMRDDWTRRATIRRWRATGGSASSRFAGSLPAEPRMLRPCS